MNTYGSVSSSSIKKGDPIKTRREIIERVSPMYRCDDTIWSGACNVLFKAGE